MCSVSAASIIFVVALWIHNHSTSRRASTSDVELAIVPPTAAPKTQPDLTALQPAKALKTEIATEPAAAIRSAEAPNADSDVIDGAIGRHPSK